MIISAIVTILVLILVISFYTYRTAFYSSPRKRPVPDAPMSGRQYEDVSENIHRISHIMEKYTFEPVSITSFDGTRLYGRYYHVRDGAPLIILVHGYRSHAFRDCSGGHALSRKMGFNALVVDQRSHGESEGRTITFGVKERKDCLCWAEYAALRFGADTPIVLSGLSMGAATVLMAAGLDLPQNVAAIMADSPFSAPISIIEKVCRDMHYPVALCRPFLYLGAWLYGGFRLRECSAKESVSKTNIPILLMHGEDDHFVPCAMSHEIAQCCASPVRVETFPGAGHGLCYMTDPRRYERVVVEFLNAIPALNGRISADFLRQFYQ